MFKVLNEHYIQNKETGGHLSLKDACDLLNIFMQLSHDVESDAEEDRDAAKKRGDMTLSLYYQGKVMACNEIRCGMKMESQYVI